MDGEVSKASRCFSRERTGNSVARNSPRMINRGMQRSNRCILIILFQMSHRIYAEKQATIITKLRKVRIITVQERNLRFRKPALSLPTTCPECGEGSLMLSPDSAAKISALEVRAICRLVEAGAIHFTEGDAGLLVCLTSVMNVIRQART
jgi:hypothetical protein